MLINAYMLIDGDIVGECIYVNYDDDDVDVG
jgi:hypothetical protein